MSGPELEAGIVAADGSALAEFYREALGFDVSAVHELPQGTVHRLTRGRAGLKIFEPSVAPVGERAPEAWSTTAGFAYAALHVDDARAIVAAAAAAGATVLTDVSSHRPGACFALIADPVGNVWEILQEDGEPA